jgi:hypothetical protein
MSSPIECLPTELLVDIAGHLSHANLGLLLQSSKHLHRRIEPILYGSPTALNQAMRWACKNARLSTIHLAASYGADVSVVHVPRVGRPRLGRLYSDLPDVHVSTLQLAAKHHHVDVFAVLLELGAQVDPRVDGHQIGYLMQHLLANELLKDHFLKAGLDSQLRERLDLDISLVLVITKELKISSRRALKSLRYCSRSVLPAPDQAMHLTVDYPEDML